MPEAKYYDVVQTRIVKVRANDAISAAKIAEAAFENGQNTDNGVKNPPEGVWGNTTSRVEVIDVHIRKDLI
jgi:hypothetical protein